LPAPPESAETLALLALRRSTPLAAIGAPGPSPADLDMLLGLAVRVPDHRKLEPWRILVFEGGGRDALGDLFERACEARRAAGEPGPAPADARKALAGSPVIVCVVSSPVEDAKRTPVWEQELSAGAVCQTLLIAAAAAGWAACWITDWPAYDAVVRDGLGVVAGERIAGFIHFGTALARPVERQRPELARLVTRRS
jgi:nitroreductase